MLPLFYTITSKECGIFHVWEEGELEQLPLSQCKVQTADPLSNGRAKLLPELICTGFTHEEARVDAGLNGIETYMKRMYDNSHSALAITGVGTGKTAAEGLSRALLNSLHHEFIKRTNEQDLSVSISLDITKIEDERCLYFLQSLQLSRSEPAIYLGKPLLGFPVVYVRSHGMWFGSIGLNKVLAVSRALQAALLAAQNKEININPYGAVFTSLSINNEKQQDVSCKSQPLHQTFLSALITLQKNQIIPQFFHLSAEPLLNKHLAGIFGVTLTEET
ncbi:hypothetical protein CGZ90_19320 [Fictibacillus aquaticus]|uniref:YcaO domain-containing protein n=1 Tax=Fictibacillus aquaticus TaxID=2021314 RepID=A0A235F4A4_9BACL|nr:hypothetical protein [Fictibacillus aquaticus]OYD56100.1 hypothetical protein CGZ90_19320 [Fictibacillus aquaticus]